jgi:hypothetical protein
MTSQTQSCWYVASTQSQQALSPSRRPTRARPTSRRPPGASVTLSSPVRR